MQKLLLSQSITRNSDRTQPATNEITQVDDFLLRRGYKGCLAVYLRRVSVVGADLGQRHSITIIIIIIIGQQRIKEWEISGLNLPLVNFQ